MDINRCDFGNFKNIADQIGRNGYLFLFMPSPFGCFRTRGRFIVGTVDELQQVLHSPVVLHPSISFYYWLVILPFRLLLLALCQAQTQLLTHLCIVSTSRCGWGLLMKQTYFSLDKFLQLIKGSKVITFL